MSDDYCGHKGWSVPKELIASNPRAKEICEKINEYGEPAFYGAPKLMQRQFFEIFNLIKGSAIEGNDLRDYFEEIDIISMSRDSANCQIFYGFELEDSFGIAELDSSSWHDNYIGGRFIDDDWW